MTVRSSLRTVLFFAHECVPYHQPESTVGAQRPAQFAKYLPDFGWRAVVVCCHRDERGTRWPSEVGERVRDALKSARADRSLVIPTPSLPWDGTLDRVWRRALPRGSHDSVLRAAARKPLTLAKFFAGDYSQAWQPCAREGATVVAREMQIDACIGEHSPDAGLFLAQWFARRFRVPWIADFRDPILQPLSPLGRIAYAPIARRLVSTAACVINVTPYWAELDSRQLRRPSVCIPNGFDPEEFAAAPLPPADGEVSIAFTGTMWREMQLEMFLEGLRGALAALSEHGHSRLRFVYRGRAVEDVRTLASRYGVADAVDARGQIPRAESLALLERSSALLLLSIPRGRSGDVYTERGFYPGKTFEYFGARRPILCVPGDGALLDELIGRTRTGVILPTAEHVTAWLLRAVELAQSGQSLEYQPDEGEMLGYSRREQARALACLLDMVAPVQSGQGLLTAAV
jgi:glycosyltransferase involved in cell wall biosynthesis